MGQSETGYLGIMHRLHARLAALARPATGFVSQPEPKTIGSFARGRQLTAGNFLFGNDGGILTNRSKPLGTDKAGWSYGGQFADFDADGHLDLYVPAGYYTAPPSVASNVDT